VKEKIDFIIHNEKNWGDKQQQVSDTLCRFLSLKNSFSVTLSHINTPKQLRTYWRLIDLVTPHMIETNPDLENKDGVSDFIKNSCGHSRIVKGKNIEYLKAKSNSNVDKKKLSEMIKFLLVICEFFKIENYELNDEEKIFLDENIIKNS